MIWPKLTRNNILAGAFTLFLVLSMAALHAAPLGLGPLLTGSGVTTDVEDTPNPASPNPSLQRNRTITLNCSTLGDHRMVPNSQAPPKSYNTSEPRRQAQNIKPTLDNGTSRTERARLPNGNGPSPTNVTRRAVPATVRATCRLIEKSKPPDWIIGMAETSPTEANASIGETHPSIDAYTNTSARARDHLALARDLQNILKDKSRSRRKATFDAAKLALAQRRAQAAAGRLSKTATQQLATQQTKLQGARALLNTAETHHGSQAGALTKAASLTELGLKVQEARLHTDTQPTAPTDLTLTDMTIPEHDAPSAAMFAILAAQNVEVTPDQAADIHALDQVPEPARSELTDVLDAYLGYYRTTQAVAGANESRVRTAQLRLLNAAADLETALETADGAASGGPSSNVSFDSGINISGMLSIDLAKDDNTYTEAYKLQIDAGGDDTYNNNAGGANASGNTTDAAALMDLGGTDTYTGRNGGGQYIVTKESPSVPDPRIPNPKKGEASGFLLDAGNGNDTYDADGHGSNGGGRRAIGFLVDAGGTDTYNGSGKGTNGAGSRRGTGFLIDVGTGSDIYAGGNTGRSNGGSTGGYGFLFDEGGDDTYVGSNGAGDGIFYSPWFVPYPINCRTDPREDNIQDRPCRILNNHAPYPLPPDSGGFLVDGGGSDTYDGANGGANRRSAGFLLDAGSSNDTYAGKNGGASRTGATGFLLDTGGYDKYLSTHHTTNGAGRGRALGFLMDGGTGDDTYDATTGSGPSGPRDNLGPGSLGTNGGGWMGGHGFLVDAGGNDSYLAGSVGTNGGATSGDGDHPPGPPSPRNPPTGFLLDAGGDDRYSAGQVGVNGGASRAVGLLYDNSGSDIYTDTGRRCIDCSEIPKGSVGAQVDRANGQGERGSRTVSAEVLVVDENAGTTNPDCPDASYQTIQKAVNDAEYGDTVRVCAGTYPGNVTVDTPNVTVRATDPGQVILDGEHKRRFGVALIAGRTTVTGFTARNFSKTTAYGEVPQPEKAAFLALGPQTTVSNTVIRDSGFGVIAGGLWTGSFLAETPVSEGEEATVITNNTVRNANVGLSVVGTGNVKVSGNTIQGTKRGITLIRAGQTTVHNNVVSGQAVPAAIEQHGIMSIRSSEVTMTGNTVTGFTTPANQTRPSGDIADGIGIEIRSPRGRGEEASHTLRNNTMANNTYNLHVTSSRRSKYQHLTIGPTNTVNGKPVLYLVGAMNMVIGPGSAITQPVDTPAELAPNRTNLPPLDALDSPGYVACVSCTNVTIRNLELGHNGQGVLIVGSTGTYVNNVTVHDTLQGISVQGSPSNTTVTESMVRESFQGIAVRHNCASRQDIQITSPLGLIFGGNTEACVTPSVVLAQNTLLRTGLLVNKRGLQVEKGQAIRVDGVGITVQENTISDGFGTAISMRGRLLRMNQRNSRTGINETFDVIANTTVVDNAIANFSVGVSVHASRGASIIGNRITNTWLGFTTRNINSVTYRDNLVTNATTGMFIHWSVDGVTARNNTFRDVRWGLDVQFTYLGVSTSSHNFGTSNTVNGEQILWVNGAVGKTIDADNANMVVCINCVDITIQDMTISDNAHGVVLWDSTSTLITNVTVEDTLRTGVLIRGGQNNTVRNSMVIDSTLPIWAMPSVEESRALRRDAGRYLPADPPQSERFMRQALGSVKIINNRVTVDDASWNSPKYMHYPARKTRPDIWGHFGIALYNPSEATVAGNTVTGNRWGVFQRGQASRLRIVNNTVRHPHQKVGMGRFGSNAHMGGPLAQMLGIRVTGSTTDLSNGSFIIRNNTLTAGTQPIGTQNLLFGISMNGKEVPPTTVADNRVNGYQQSVRLGVKSNNLTVSIRRNRLNGAKSASVFITGSTPGEAVAIHQNLLNPLAFGYGVKYSTQGGSGGHMGGGGDGRGSTATHDQPVNATCNRWAAPSGASSQRMTLIDPVTGEAADGNGSAVSQGHMHGESNVHFHPWLGESPRLSCAAAKVGTPTPTPIPTATRTPWPTVGAGDGTGPGQGDGTGPGQGDGTGPGQGTDDGGGTGPITSTARVNSTATRTVTPPPTATPEIVPGFGVVMVLVAFGLLVAVLAVLRRD